MKKWLLALLALCGCPAATLPGDQSMGSWAMSATSAEQTGACALAEFDGGALNAEGFDLILTRQSTTAQAWLTTSGITREAQFDGQYVVSVVEATRVFSRCSECRTRLEERIELAVLSRSQTDALGGQCRADALDGGVPLPNDAGIVGPSQTSAGFDAARLCGALTTRVLAEGEHSDGGACAVDCAGCGFRYVLRGERR